MKFWKIYQTCAMTNFTKKNSYKCVLHITLSHEKFRHVIWLPARCLNWLKLSATALYKRSCLNSLVYENLMSRIPKLFANSLDPDQDRQNVSLNLDLNCLILCNIHEGILKKASRRQQSMININRWKCRQQKSMTEDNRVNFL